MKEKKDINLVIGANIRREREKAGYTQERFSELIDMGPKNLSAVERGAVGISLSALCRICGVLSVSADALLFEQEPCREPGEPGELEEKLRRLSPRQYDIAAAVLHKLLEAFSLGGEAYSPACGKKTGQKYKKS